MDFLEVRRLVIIAMFSDDLLSDKLVLKGGNALRIIHQVGSRTSLDIDFSIQDDFENLDDVRARIFRALKETFGAAGYVVFDERFETLPPDPLGGKNLRWGGYVVEFKLIDIGKYEALLQDLESARRDALVIGGGQKRSFRVQISKHEFCDGKEEFEVDAHTIYVYSRAMIAAEKLRAICQQMPEYSLTRHKAARARDFCDIYFLVTEGGVDLGSPANKELIKQIFSAMDVPLELLGNVSGYREFHRPDWPSVVDSVSEGLMEFDFYFDFVLAEIDRLKPLWME